MSHPGVLALMLVASSAFGAGIDSVEVDAVVDPGTATVASTATLVITPEPGAEVIELLLNRELEITGVAADVGLAGFEHVRGGDGPYRYAPQATPLRVRLAAPSSGDPLEFRVTSRGRVEPDAYGVVQVGAAWVELVAAYSGWVPIDGTGETFALRLDVSLPAGWAAVGTGGLALSGGRWSGRAEDAVDVVVIAAPRLDRLDAGDGLSVVHVDLPADAAERIATAASRTRDTFSRWFGPAAGGRVEVVFAPRAEGGGYARPGLVVMLYDLAPGEDPGSDPGFMRYLAHEVSHLWWRGASTTDWEDWLNESFAEISALMLLRERFGEEVFAGLLERYREASAGLPPVRGIGRGDENAYEVLYRKGPVLLAELESTIGREAFRAFLRARLADGALTTDACLAVLERAVSPEARSWLEHALGR